MKSKKGPWVKCETCDFKSEYKFNLDRHYKNHNTKGSLRCPISKCTFSCNAKQSLSVHVTKHHTVVPENITELLNHELLRAGKLKGSGSESSRSKSSSLSAAKNLHTISKKLRESSLLTIRKTPNLIRRGKPQFTVVHPPSKRVKTDAVEITGELQIRECHFPLCNYNATSDRDLNRHITQSHPSRRKILPRITKKHIPSLIPITISHCRSQEKPASSCNRETSNPVKEDHARASGSSSPQAISRSSVQGISQNSRDSFKQKLAFLANFDMKPKTDCLSLPSFEISDERNPRLSPVIANQAQGLTSSPPRSESKNVQGSSTSKAVGPQRARRSSFLDKLLTQKLAAKSKPDSDSPKCFSLNNLTITCTSTRCQDCRVRFKTSLALLSHLGHCPKAKNYLTESINEEDNQDEGVSFKKQKSPASGKVFKWSKSPVSSNSADDEEYDMKLRTCINKEAKKPDSTPSTGSINLEEDEGLNSSLDDSMDNKNGNRDGYVTKFMKVYKCVKPSATLPIAPCEFWATTPSRFHVHMITHNNEKSIKCPYCSYRSNWIQDINTHIRNKSKHDPTHPKETVNSKQAIGEEKQKMYPKYDKYLVGMEIKYSVGSKLPDCSTVASKRSDVEFNLRPSISSPPVQKIPRRLRMPTLKRAPASATPSTSSSVDCERKDVSQGRIGRPPTLKPMSVKPGSSTRTFIEKKMLSGGVILQNMDSRGKVEISTPVKTGSSSQGVGMKPRKWKCKKCSFKHSNKDVTIIHFRYAHKPKKGEPVSILIPNNLPAVTHQNEIKDDVNSYVDDKINKGLQGQKRPTRSVLTTTSRSHIVEEGMDLVFSKMQTPLPFRCVSGDETRHKSQGPSLVKSSSYSKYGGLELSCEVDSEGESLRHKQVKKPREGHFNRSQFPYTMRHKQLQDQPSKVHLFDSSADVKSEFVPSLRSGDTNNQSLAKHQECISLEAVTNGTRHPTVLVRQDDVMHRVFRCRDCPQGFENSNSLTEHAIQTGHNQVPSSPMQEAINLSLSARRNSTPKMNNLFHKMDLYAPNLPTPSTAFTNPPQPKRVIHLCDECPARYFKQEELKEHQTFHNYIKKLQYHCEVCSYSCKVEETLMSHIPVHEEDYQNETKRLLAQYPRAARIFCVDSEYTPPISISSASGVTNFRYRSSELKKPDGSIKCRICPSQFNTMALFKQHLNNHGRAAPYICRYCDYGTNTECNLKLHEIVHSGSEITIEPIVPAATFHNKSLIVSRITETENAEVIISPKRRIDDTFGEEVYRGNPEFIYPTSGKNGRTKRYKCIICPSAFDKRKQCETHIGLHGSGKTYKCTVPGCNYAVTNVANIAQHLKVHENQPGVPSELLKIQLVSNRKDKMTSCTSKTNKITTSSSSTTTQSFTTKRKRPERTSTIKGPKPPRRIIRCGRCPFSTFENKKFDEHWRHHTMENPDNSIPSSGRCQFCDFATEEDNLLRDHIRLHFSTNKPTEKPNASRILVQNAEIIASGNDMDKLYSEKENYHSENQSQNDKKIVKKPEPGIAIDLKRGLPISLLK